MPISWNAAAFMPSCSAVKPLEATELIPAK